MTDNTLWDLGQLGATGWLPPQALVVTELCQEPWMVQKVQSASRKLPIYAVLTGTVPMIPVRMDEAHLLAAGSLTKGTCRYFLWCESYQAEQGDGTFSTFIRPFSIVSFLELNKFKRCS